MEEQFAATLASYVSARGKSPVVCHVEELQPAKVLVPCQFETHLCDLCTLDRFEWPSVEDGSWRRHRGRGVYPVVHRRLSVEGVKHSEATYSKRLEEAFS